MTIKDTARKITIMEIRGAGKIGRAAAKALLDFATELDLAEPTEFINALKEAKEILQNTRPTAVSLTNALEAVMNGAKGDSVDELRAGVVIAAKNFISRSEQAVEKIAELCASKIKDGYTLLTHCNSSVVVNSIIKAHENGKKIRVYATETRPWRQGHITAQALAAAGVDVTLIVDSAVRFFMAEIDLVLVGSDTVAANGTVINKIGTSQIALIAHEKRVPVFVCAETYKFSKATLNGDSVPIEERDHAEIVEPGKLPGVKLRNPVFDATPPEYIDSIITEVGIISPSAAKEILTKNMI